MHLDLPMALQTVMQINQILKPFHSSIIFIILWKIFFVIPYGNKSSFIIQILGYIKLQHSQSINIILNHHYFSLYLILFIMGPSPLSVNFASRTNDPSNLLLKITMAYFLFTLHVGQQVCLQFYSMYIFLFIFWYFDWRNSLWVEHSVLIGNEKEQDCWQKCPVVCVASVYTSLAKANHMTKPDSGSGKYTSLSRGHCKSQGNEQGHIIPLTDKQGATQEEYNLPVLSSQA